MMMTRSVRPALVRAALGLAGLLAAGSLLAGGPAAAQGLASGPGLGPSQQLAVPPNERGKPDFTFNPDRVRSRAHTPPAGRPHRPARARPATPAGHS